MSYSSPVSGMATPEPKLMSTEDKSATSWLSMTQTIYDNEEDEDDGFLNGRNMADGGISDDHQRAIGSAV